jgi:hypothetical protein
MSFTYAELKQAIKDYVETEEATFVNNLPLFIRLAEERILKSVRLNLFQKNASATLGIGSPYLAAPPDFLSALSCSITTPDGVEFLLLKDLDFIQTTYPDVTDTGRPRYFASFDVDNFLIGPPPDAAYPVTLHYFYRPASLTAGPENGRTWLSENAPLSMLYGALFEAYTFLKGDNDLMQLYAGRFAESLGRLKDLGEAKETTTDYRFGKLRIPRS